MKHSFFVFAPGWPGVALLLLRVSVSAFLITIPFEKLSYSYWEGAAIAALALIIALGLQTRLGAVLAGIVALWLLVSTGNSPLMPLTAHALDAIVLAIAGPGAYSLDSRLFGRRTLRLPE